MPWKLMRTWYPTDLEPGVGGGIGTFSGPIPDAAFPDASHIVNADWTKPGTVEVTFLIRM